MTVVGIVLGLFFLGFCIFIHELGHFLAAKWRGLHIIAFSIGFKKIWGFKHKGIDYRIGCIPCGGYVDLPQIDTTNEAKDEHGNTLPPAKPIDRIITAIAGPLFNVFFGIFLSLIVWYVGVPQDTPKMKAIVVEDLQVFSPEYKAGLRDGDKIIELNGGPFNCSWGNFVRKIIFTVGDVNLKVDRDGKVFDVKYRPAPNKIRTPQEEIAYPFFLPILPIKCEIKDDSEVAKAGMKSGDIITKLNGLSMADANELRTALSLNMSDAIVFTVKRDGKEIVLTPIVPKVHEAEVYRTGVILGDSFTAKVAKVDQKAELNVVNDFKIDDQILKVNGLTISNEYMFGGEIEASAGKPIKFLIKRGSEVIEFSKTFPLSTDTTAQKGDVEIIYSYDFPIWLTKVMPNSPASEQGFKQFDRLITLNGKKIEEFKAYINTISESKGKELTLEIERDGKLLTKTIASKPFNSYTTSDIGLNLIITAHPTPFDQFHRVITMTYNSLRGIFSKDSTLKPRHLSGPIGIFRGIGVTFSAGGIMPVIALIVLITYSLAILNIMPLPVLDGGHVVFALIEMVIGKPLSPKIIQPLVMVFIVFLMGMMLYVTFYDALRLRSNQAPKSVTKEYRYLIVGNNDIKK
jgi:RIP metalloprotease RseP